MQHFKHITTTAILSLFLSLPAHSSISPDGIWSDSPNRSLLQKEFSYRAINASAEELVNQLQNAPLEGTTSQGLEFFLPLPSGDFERVSVFESPIMSPALAAKLPDIKTYKVTGLDNPEVSGRLDASSEGFHGFLNTSQGVIYIEPESSYNQSSSTEAYRSFNKANFPASKHEYKCSVIGHDHSDSSIDSFSQRLPQISAMRSSGTTVRTYRLALAATAEYTAAVSSGTPTVAKGQAAIVTAINRINAIYEKEVSVKFELIDNTNIVFTNAATDGYTNNNGIALLGENKTKLNTVITTANFDIGHVFSTGGGGVAALASVCDDAGKAQGVTGSPNPVGDPFVVDYVAHEIGHQFGAPHTFNAGGNSSGSCDDSNRENHASTNGGTQLSDSAYEPGSGTTIMAYAGICYPQNIQNNSNPYFHARSLEQIREFVENEIPYSNTQGGSCGTEVYTGNTPPSAEAGDNYTIPANTPFALTGNGNDADKADVATLNYTWEQFDLGSKTTNLAEVHTDSDTRPIIRSRQGTSSPTRYIPALDAILENNLTKHIGERLPTTDRDMKFRLTVRSGTSGFNQDDMTITVDKDAGPLIVTAPAAASVFAGGSQVSIQWDVANTQLAPVNCSHMTILYSIDGGQNFEETIEASTPNDGSQEVTLPNTTTTQGRIKVQCLNNIFFNVSPGNFTVNKTSLLDISATSTDNIEGNSENSIHTFTVTRSDITSGISSVSYAVTGIGNNPAASTDFVDNAFPAGVVSFSDGETNKIITINIAGDSVIEPDESFIITLLNPISASITTATAMSSILNDDSSLSIHSGNFDRVEGNSGSTPYTFNVLRSGATIGASSVMYAVTSTGNNPVTANDFIGNVFPSGSVNFADGESTKTITINVSGDVDIETDENFTVTLSDPTLSSISTATANATIKDDDTNSSTTSSGGGSGGSGGLLLILLLPALLIKRKR
jgi:hypothetical protein